MDTITFYNQLYSIKSRLASDVKEPISIIFSDIKWLQRRFASSHRYAAQKEVSFASWRRSGAPNTPDLIVTMSGQDFESLGVRSVDEFVNDDYTKANYPDVTFVDADKKEEPELIPEPQVQEEKVSEEVFDIECGRKFSSNLLQNSVVKDNLDPLRGGVRVFNTINLKLPSDKTVNLVINDEITTLGPGDSFTVVCGLDIKLNAMEQAFRILGGMGGDADRMSKSALAQVRTMIGEVNFIGLDNRNESHLTLPSFKAELDKVIDESIQIYAIGVNESNLYSIKGESGDSSLTWSIFNKATHSGNSLTHKLLNSVRETMYNADPNEVKKWLKDVEKPLVEPGLVAKFSKSLGGTDVIKSFFEADPEIEAEYLRDLDQFIDSYLDKLQDRKGKDLSKVFKLYKYSLENLALQEAGKDKSKSAEELGEAVKSAKADVRGLLSLNGDQASKAIEETIRKAKEANIVNDEELKFVESYLNDSGNVKVLDKQIDILNKQHLDRIPQEQAVKQALNRLEPSLYERIKKKFEEKAIRGGVHTLMKLEGADKLEAIEILDEETKRSLKSGTKDIKATIDFVNTSGLQSIYDTGERRKLPALYILIKNITDANAPLGYSQTDPMYSSRTAWKSAHHTVQLGKLLDQYSNLGVKTSENKSAIASFRKIYESEHKGDSELSELRASVDRAEKRIQELYLKDKANNPNVSFEVMVEECEDPDLVKSLEDSLQTYEDKLETRIRSDESNLSPKLISAFPGIDKFKTTNNAYEHILSERTKLDDEATQLRMNFREHVLTSAKPFLGYAGNPIAQLTDHVNKSMGTSVPIRKFDNSGPANIRDLKGYLKAGNINEVIYGVIGLSVKHSRGASTAKPRKPSSGRSIYAPELGIKNKAAQVKEIDSIIKQIDKLRKAVIDVTKSYDEYKSYPLDDSRSNKYRSSINTAVSLCKEIDKLNKDRIPYIEEIIKAVEVYIHSPELMENSAIGRITSDVTGLSESRSDAGSVLFNGIRRVNEQLNSTKEFVEKKAKPTSTDVYVNEYSISPEEAQATLFKIFNDLPNRYSIKTAVKYAKNFAQNKYEAKESSDYVRTNMGLWMLEGDQEAMTEAARKMSGTTRSDVRSLGRETGEEGFRSVELKSIKTAPSASTADVRHAVHILVGYLGGRMQRVEFKRLNKLWQAYILESLKDPKHGSRNWAELLDAMKEFGFWVDIKSVEDLKAEPGQAKSGMELLAHNTNRSLGLAVTALGYYLEGHFPPSTTTLRNIVKWLDGEGKEFKEDLVHFAVHTPELVHVKGLEKVKDTESLLEALRTWQTIKQESGFDFKQLVTDLLKPIEHWCRKAGLDYNYLKLNLVGAARDPFSHVKTEMAEVANLVMTDSVSPNKNLIQWFNDLVGSTLNLLNPKYLEAQAKIPGALGRFFGRLESENQKYSSAMANLESNRGAFEFRDNLRSIIETKLSGRRHSWNGPAVKSISGDDSKDKYYLFGFEYKTEADWQKDKNLLSSRMNAVIRGTEKLIQDLEEMISKTR